MCEILKMDPKKAAKIVLLHVAEEDFATACSRLRAAKKIYVADPIENNLRKFTYELRTAEMLTERLLQLEMPSNVEVRRGPTTEGETK